MNKIMGRTFRNEFIDLDFTHWEKCSFIGCEIHTTHGIFRLTHNDFTNCNLHVHGQAETIARLLQSFFKDKPIVFNKRRT